MRVTGGTARGRRLKSPRSGVRPTSDLVRSAIFDVVEAHGYEMSPALDLYAGTGALGIEAISRGAKHCDFVEANQHNITVIKENIAVTGVAHKASVIRSDVKKATARLKGPYALVLADPPYDDDAAVSAVELVVGSGHLTPHPTLVLELSSRQPAPAVIGRLARTWMRQYGDTQVCIYRAAVSAPKREE